MPRTMDWLVSKAPTLTKWEERWWWDELMAALRVDSAQRAIRSEEETKALVKD